jgi:hypothetical protein
VETLAHASKSLFSFFILYLLVKDKTASVFFRCALC